MAAGSQELDRAAQSAGIEAVYIVPWLALNLGRCPLTIGGQPVTALAPHPAADDLAYATTGHPEVLSFLPDPYVTLEP